MQRLHDQRCDDQSSRCLAYNLRIELDFRCHQFYPLVTATTAQTWCAISTAERFFKCENAKNDAVISSIFKDLSASFMFMIDSLHLLFNVHSCKSTDKFANSF